MTIVFKEISRDILTIFFLFLTIDKSSDFDILTNSWPQWVDKMIKVSSQSALVQESYVANKLKNLAWHFVWQPNFQISFHIFRQQKVAQFSHRLSRFHIQPTDFHLTPARSISDGSLRSKMNFNLAWQKIEGCLYSWYFEKTMIKKKSNEPMSFIFEKCRLYIINIISCQNWNHKSQTGHRTFCPTDGSRNRTIEPCAANISVLIRDNPVIFLCGSEEFLVEHTVKISQELVE